MKFDIITNIIKKADNFNINKNKFSPLLLACYFNNEEMVKTLIEQKFNLNVENNNGDAPLTIACYYNNKNIIKLLINNGAKVNVQNNDGETPLTISKNFENNEEIIDILRKNNLKIKDEMFIKKFGKSINYNEFQEVAKNSVFQIEYKISKDEFEMGTGFFIKLPIPSKNKPMYGLITYITFIQFTDDLINELNLKKKDFLTSHCNDIKINNKNDNIIFVLQYPMGEDFHFAVGNIESDYGFDYFHTGSTESGSSGSPLINNNFEVLGVHKTRREGSNENEDVNVATKFSIIEYAIRT
eukprot:jgi/Orpsp1_1/1185386/evm.model.c7180000093523.1